MPSAVTFAGETSTRAGSRRISLDQMGDFAGHGGREQHRMALRAAACADDLAHVADEAHVEHAVGLVDDERASPRPAAHASG